MHGEKVSRTRPRVVVVTGCTPHMSWSPCVHARVLSVCPRHAQGRAMVPPWCGQGFPWCSLLWVTFPPPIREQYEPFSLFMEETSICMRKHNGIINKYKLKFQKSLSLHLHHLSLVRAQYMSSSPTVRVWLAHNARLAHSQCVSGPLAVHVWLAHRASLARPWCTSGSPAMQIWLTHDLFT